MRSFRILLTTCLVIMLAGSATGAAGDVLPGAPASLPWAKPVADQWTLSGDSEGDPVCALRLGATAALGGASIQVSATCRRNYPLEAVVNWTLKRGAIRLNDVHSRAVLTLAPAPLGGYAATFPDGRTVTLERGPPERPRTVKALFDQEGTFTLSGPNNAGACGFAVSAVASTRGKLEQAGRCPAPWKKRGWASWTLQGQHLALKDSSGAVILSLSRADEYTFQAQQPDGPVFFGPGVIDGSEMLERQLQR